MANHRYCRISPRCMADRVTTARFWPCSRWRQFRLQTEIAQTSRRSMLRWLKHNRKIVMAAQDGIRVGGGINGGPGLVAGPGEAGVLPLYLAGDWRLKTGLPTPAVIEKQLEDSSGLRLLTLDASDLGDWDSGLLAFLVGIEELCRARRIDLDTGNLPEGARRLLRLATAVPERQGARRTQARPDFLTLVGTECLSLWQGGGAMLGFIGEAMQSFSRLVIGHA